MKSFIYIAFNVVFLLHSCSSQKILIDQLSIVNGVFYYNNSTFSGLAYSKFKSGALKGKTFFKEGIPTGSWEEYDYDGDIIQQGTYQNIRLNAEVEKAIQGIKRINLRHMKEGDSLLIDLLIVTNVAPINSRRDTLDKILIETLKLNNIPIKDREIHRVLYVKSEFN